jgi:hypothetical protein
MYDQIKPPNPYKNMLAVASLTCQMRLYDRWGMVSFIAVTLHMQLTAKLSSQFSLCFCSGNIIQKSSHVLIYSNKYRW